MAFMPETTVNVTAQSTYPTDPQVVALFTPSTWTFFNKSSASAVHISYDGKVDALPLDPNLDTGFTTEISGVRKVWIRRDTAGGDTVNVVVSANS